ncbi:MAG: flavocytochrome c [Cellulosilyticaceae bacterium]
MKITKRLATLLIAGMLSTSMLAGCASKPVAETTSVQKSETKTDVSGKFEGQADGKHGAIKVAVSLEKGKITDIAILETSENVVLAEPVYAKVSQTMINNNNVNVDTISGATETSNGYIKAVQDALSKAGVTMSGDKIPVEHLKETETEQTYDVVVIGAGGAGFSAALEAKNAGANVVVLEKMPAVGGNTLISGAEMNAPNTWVQKKLGLEDSPEKFFEDTMKGGDNLGNPELVKYLANNAKESAEWLKDYVGVEFLEDKLFQFGGHSVKRALIPTHHTGEDMVTKFKLKADELKIPVKTEIEAKELIVENDKVVGVKATNAAGQELTFKANKGVVIASGGFGANLEMCEKYNPEYNSKYLTTDAAGTTGDGIVMAEAVGAALTGMKYIQTYPVCNPETGVISLLADSRFDGAILINQEGNRFVEELERRDVISKAILAQTGGYAYQVWNQHIGEIGGTLEAHQEEFKMLEKQGLIHKADTIEECAEFFKVPVETLKATMEKVNTYAKEGKDKDFNHRAGLVAMEEGPYYIQKAVPSIHHTMGGIVVDVSSHVINKDGKVIKGLYAAGEVTGGIHGSNRLGGNAIADITVFGRNAGKNVAAEK